MKAHERRSAAFPRVASLGLLGRGARGRGGAAGNIDRVEGAQALGAAAGSKGSADAENDAEPSGTSPSGRRMKTNGGSMKVLLASFYRKEELLRAVSTGTEESAGSGPPSPKQRPKQIALSKSSTSIRGEAKSFSHSVALNSTNLDSPDSRASLHAPDALPKAFPDRRASEATGNAVIRGSLSRAGQPSFRSSYSQMTLDSPKQPKSDQISVEEALRAMQRQRHLEDRMESALRALLRALRADKDAAKMEEQRAWFVQQHGLFLILALLQMYPENHEIQERGLIALVICASGDVEAQRALAEGGAVGTLLNMLSTGGEEMTLQDRAISALLNLTIAPELRRQLVASKSLMSVLAVMKAFSHIGSVQAEGCAFIASVVSANGAGTSGSDQGAVIADVSKAKLEAVDEGAASVITAALRLHSASSLPTATRACVALRNLSHSCRPAQTAIISCEGIQAIVYALSVQPHSPALGEHAQMALLSLLVDDEKAKAIFDQSGGVELATNALKRWGVVNSGASEGTTSLLLSSEVVSDDSTRGAVLAAFGLLHARTKYNARNRAFVVDAGGLEATVNTLAARCNDSAVLRAGGAVLHVLASGDPSSAQWRVTQLPGGIEALLTVFRAAGSVRAELVSADAALTHKLSSSSSSRKSAMTATITPTTSS